jgi:hypothetical protein
MTDVLDVSGCTAAQEGVVAQGLAEQAAPRLGSGRQLGEASSLPSHSVKTDHQSQPSE